MYIQNDVYPERCWFTVDRNETVAKLHKLITQQPNIGKIIFISTLEKTGREFNKNEPLSALELAYVIGELPESIRNQLIAPYANPERGIARINAKVKESGERFSLDKMVSKIERFATVELGLEPENVKVTGMMVLFNERLKKLADSQLKKYSIRSSQRF